MVTIKLMATMYELWRTNDDGSADDLVEEGLDRDEAIKQAKEYPLDGTEYAYVVDPSTRTDAHPRGSMIYSFTHIQL